MRAGNLVRAAFTTNRDNLDSPIEPAFGRCRNFLVVGTAGGDVTVVPIPGGAASGGAGIRAAETLAGLRVDKVVTGSVGLNAGLALSAAGILVDAGSSGTIRAYLDAALGRCDDPPGSPPPSTPHGEGTPTQARDRSGYCCCPAAGFDSTITPVHPASNCAARPAAPDRSGVLLENRGYAWNAAGWIPEFFFSLLCRCWTPSHMITLRCRGGCHERFQEDSLPGRPFDRRRPGSRRRR